MTLKELIEDGLKRHGYDGLFSPDVCACKIGDLAPCGGYMGWCEPGVFTEGPCSNCCGGKLCDFHIGHGIPNTTAHKRREAAYGDAAGSQEHRP